MAINVKDFGALGDGSEASSEIQTAINSLPSAGGEVFIPSGSYRIDNSLLNISSKNNFKIILEKNSILFTQKHGHGIFEISNSDGVTILGGKLIGAGNFVDKNFGGSNGGGEKIYTLSQNYGWGYHRNSNLTALGAHNNGYIGNSGIGILIRDGSKNISIRDIEVEQFNYSGIQIQFLGDLEAIQKNYCEQIKITECYVHDIYGAGISLHGCEHCIVSNNHITNIGHPNTDGTEIQVNPGYGTTIRGVAFDGSHGKNIIVSNNNYSNCKRKGIDSHSGENLIIEGNTVDKSLIQGIGMGGNSGTRKTVIISDNIISNSGNVQGAQGVDSKIGISNSYPDSVIKGNIIKNSGYSFGIYNTGSNTIIDSNNIIYTTATQYQYTSGIRIDGNSNAKVKNNIISNNSVIGDINIWRGMQLDYVEDGRLKDNLIKIGSTDELLLMTNCKISVDHNSWNTFVFNNGNSGDMASVEFCALVEYNGGNEPEIKYINTKEEWFSSPKDIPGGQGQVIQFASNSKNPDILISEEQLFTSISYINKIGVEYIALSPQFSGTKLICHISPKDSSNNLIYSSHPSINGLKFQIRFTVALQR